MKKRRIERWHIVIGLLVVLLLVVGTLLQRPTNQFDAPEAHFSDSTPTGSKGLALVLNQLGYSTRVQDEPLEKMPADAWAWLIFDPNTSFSTKEAQALMEWVKKGGTLIFCSSSSNSMWRQQQFGSGITHLRSELGIESTYTNNASSASSDVFPDFAPFRFNPTAPEREGVTKASSVSGDVSVTKPAFGISGVGTGPSSGPSLLRFDRGRGRVYVLPDAWLFTNYGLSKPANAVLATNLIRLHTKGGAVVWDERRHGDDLRPPEPDSVLARVRKPPFSYALWQLLFAGLLFWTFTSRRLGVAVPLPERGSVTRASQFALAMGGLFQKIGRPSAASQIVGDNFRRRLAARLGLSPADPDPVLAQRAQEMGGVPYEVVDRLLLQTRTPAQNEAQALRDAQEMDMVLRKLEER